MILIRGENYFCYGNHFQTRYSKYLKDNFVDAVYVSFHFVAIMYVVEKCKKIIYERNINYMAEKDVKHEILK